LSDTADSFVDTAAHSKVLERYHAGKIGLGAGQITSRHYATIRDPTSPLDGRRVGIAAKTKGVYTVFDPAAGFPMPIYKISRKLLVDIEYPCANCGVYMVGMRRCSKCKEDYYCSRKCQLQDWAEHKKRHHVKAKAKASASTLEASDTP